MSTLVYVAGALIALSVLVGGLALSPNLQTRRERRVSSISQYVPSLRVDTARADAGPAPSQLSEQLVGFGERQMRGKESTKSTMALIARADLPLRAGEWFVLRSVAAVVGACVALFLAREAAFTWFLAAGVVGAGLGLLLPAAVLSVLARRRAQAFESVLPDVLTLVATSLRSGFGLAQALDAVARDAAEPAAKEFSRALAETRIGTEVDDALEHMALRMDSTSMRWTVMAIRIQREVGGNLAETLSTTAGTLKERDTIRRQVRALSAEGRLSAYILIALPIGVFLFMTMANYEYISKLWTTGLGMVMLGAGLVALFIGIIWMRKVVTIEV